LPPRSRQDRDIVGTIGEHTVCWRYFGDESPHKGHLSIILKTPDGWENLGVWKKGPLSLSDIEGKIALAIKK
jgi:hypothetical protein